MSGHANASTEPQASGVCSQRLVWSGLQDLQLWLFKKLFHGAQHGQSVR